MENVTVNVSVAVAGRELTEAEGAAYSWAVFLFLGLVGVAGAVGNGLVAGGLLRGGALPALAHLALADLASLLLVAPPELLALSAPSLAWPFPEAACPAFLALETAAGTASVYLLLVLNLSALSESPSPAALPLALVWALSVSLAVPGLATGRVVRPRSSLPLCSLHNRAALLLYASRAGLPAVLLAASLVLLLSSPPPPPYSSLPLLHTLFHLLFSFHRPLLALVFAADAGDRSFYTPPLAPTTSYPLATLLLSFLHYTALALRPLLSYLASETVRNSLRKKPEEDVSTEP